MKYIALFLCVLLVGCGAGSNTPDIKTMSVQLSPDTVLPNPFVIGPGNTQAVPGTPVVTFVTGPVSGPVAVITSTPILPAPNWCTDGFVIGPCTLRCLPGQFVVGPCP
jgi:hypothetical protein